MAEGYRDGGRVWSARDSAWALQSVKRERRKSVAEEKGEK